jgi:isoamylase
VTEFKEVVKAFHSAGVKVTLDVVHNHTAEGQPSSLTIGFRGIDNLAYYRINAETCATTWTSAREQPRRQAP